MRGRNASRGERVKQFEPFRHQAENRLVRLEVATSLKELGALRGNRLEKLSGDRKGQWSMRINDQWRICFEWSDGAAGPNNVKIVDYH
ncbi:MAG TPA: type II toxin-antitoxin system RelE/ParE family toxin [Rhizomicrobium sp.]|jgi:proteic killer suppression protein|nr:type II toxin-antitoxin system RelE/ParE family toxin [Rhizomicrobium sp.]